MKNQRSQKEDVPAQRVVVTARRVQSTRQRKPSDDHEHAAVEREAGSADEAQGDQEALASSPGIGEGQREPARGELGDQCDRENGEGGRGALTRLLLDLAAHRVEAESPAEQPVRRHGRRGESEHGRRDGRRIPLVEPRGGQVLGGLQVGAAAVVARQR
jgi:hypothetical protein